MKTYVLLACVPALIFSFAASAETANVTMNSIDAKGVGKAIGTVVFSDTPKGLSIQPALSGLTPGDHGLHVHQNPSCAPAEKDGKMGAGLAAGGHYDPKDTKQHTGPNGHGHLGDLPVLVVGADGKANTTMYVAHLKVADIKGRSLMIHEGGDNFSDQPKPLGGGGARVACGLIK
jgi:superoxide dismutase, Cu-Zn family